MTDWSQILRQYGPAVWKTVSRLLRNPADAEDCFQNTFVAALELSSSQEIRNWPALLKQLATRRALERLRCRYRESKRSSPLPEQCVNGQPVAGKSPQPDEAALANELAERLRIALSRIDKRQAEVFCLGCLEEMSYAEIADRLELSVSHVGVLLNRARAALRKELPAYQPSERCNMEQREQPRSGASQ
jgi:RNA polymerase sigma-70 factor (ECF subfamily)